MIFDSHCHLNDEILYGDVENVIKRAKNAGIARFLVLGYDKASSFKAVEIAEKYEGIYAGVGFQPEELNEATLNDLEEVMALAKHPKVVCIGEIGLDYYWEKDPVKIQKQKDFFIKQIEYANSFGLPISIHCRDAIEDTLNILKEHKVIKGGVMHCYSGSVESAKEFIKVGMYISLGGPVTFKNAKTPKEVASAVPLDKLLVETDSPYLAPHPLRGTTNEPANIVYVVNEIARLRNVDISEIEKATYENASKLFHV